jgi:hypothetical protein
MGFSKWLADKGFTEATLSATMRATLRAAYLAEVGTVEDEEETEDSPEGELTDDEEEEDPEAEGEETNEEEEEETPPTSRSKGVGVDSVFKAARSEGKRQDKITLLAARAIKGVYDQKTLVSIEKVAKNAIKTGQTPEQAELQILRVSRGNPGNMARSAPPAKITSQVLEVALLRAMSMPSRVIEKAYSEYTLEACDKRYKGGSIHLKEFIGICAKSRGYRGHVSGDASEALRVAFMPMGMPGMPMAVGGGTASTLSISGILSNVANKFVREAFMFVEQDWRNIASIRSVPDFKEVSGYSLASDLTFQKVAGSGPVSHGKLSERSYGNKAETFARMLGASREQIINDDLNALSAIPKLLGKGGAQALVKAVWTEFMDNAAFFATGNANYLAHATDSVLNETGLAKAYDMFVSQIDENGDYTGLEPKLLLVPPALYPAAWKIVNSEQDQNAVTTPGVGTGKDNPWIGMFDVVKSRYLNNAAITGYSPKAWYLLAAPGDTPVIEVCFLNGQEIPVVEMVEFDATQLGIGYRGVFDFGVRKQEYRAGVKMKGEA